MSLYDKYFTIMSIWLVMLAIMVRMQIGVAFVLVSSLGFVFFLLCLAKYIKLIKPIKKRKKV